MCLALGAWADDIPFREQRRELFQVMPINEESIVFLGNSITNFNVWSDAFGGDIRVVNRGIAGITSDEVLEYIDLIACGKPQKLFIMIGINDFATPEITEPNIRAMIDVMQRESPKTEIYIQSVLPTNRAERSAYVEPWNEQLKALCKKKGVTYIDVWSKVIKSATDHGLKADYTTDNLHMNGPGYREWTRGFEQYTGLKPVYAEGAATYGNGFNTVENMQLSTYALLPVEEGDVLMLGDWNVYMGEWAELLRNPKVKNRGVGTGIGYSLTLDHLLAMIPHIVKPAVGKVFISCGAKDLYNNVAPATAAQTYSRVLDAIRTAAPEAEIYVQSILPDALASVNAAKMEPFNAAIKALAEQDASGKVKFVDVYGALTENGALAAKYVSANTEQSKGVNGRAYLRWANLIAPYINKDITPLPELSDAEFELTTRLWQARHLKRNADVGEELGQYPASALEGLTEAIATAVAVLADKGHTEEDMAAEAQKLADICNAAEAAKVKMPRFSTAEAEHWYTMATPLRDNRHMQSAGAGNGVTGATAANTARQQWKFVERTDATLDIINRADGSFLDPASAPNNQQLLTAAASPSQGWTLSEGANRKYFIITSGSVQINQTNASLGYKIYNWGGGANKDDAGCQFLISPATFEPEPPATLPQALLILTDITFDGSQPYRIDDALARPVLEAEKVTVAVDFTLSTTAAEQTLVGSSNSAAAESFASISVNNANNFGVRFNNTSGKYSQNATIGTSRHQIVVAMQPENPAYDYYIDGNFLRNVTAAAPTLGSVERVDALYLGGLVCSDNPNKYPLRGTIHSVQFFPGKLSTDEIALISYDNLKPTAIQTIKAGQSPLYSINNRRILVASDTPAQLFDASGRPAPLGQPLPAGIYLLRVAHTTQKVLVE